MSRDKKGIYVISFDIGTTGNKTCLFEISDQIKLVAGALAEYKLYIGDNGGVEQSADEWWTAMRESTKAVLKKTKIDPDDIKAIGFCSQMQGLVLVDEEGNALRNPMSYMDTRGAAQKEKYGKGIINIEGLGLIKLLTGLRLTAAAPASVKDPIWRYKWVQDNEPEIFKRVYKWLDVKEYLIMRCTGRAVMTEDSAFGTFLYDLRKGKRCWSEKLCKMYGVDINHLPEVVAATELVGGLTEKAAADLGLSAGTAVFASGGDAVLLGVGAGAVNDGDTHIYIGTSGWISTVTRKPRLDVVNMIASVIAARPGYYNFFAEQETAGKCLEWAKDHLALDEIDIYLEKKKITDDPEAQYRSLYDYLSAAASTVEPGCGGVIFTPWLHGNRCPFEDPNARGIFFNISLETGKRALLRALMEGNVYHLRWMMEAMEKTVKTAPVIRFVGGGALSDLSCQMLADVTGKIIEVPESPQNAGAVGAAVISALGLGIIKDFSSIKEYIPIYKIFTPSKADKEIYDKNYRLFKKLYKANKKLFKEING